MLKTTRIKKTKQRVFPIISSGEYTYVLLPFDGISRRGNRGVVQIVRNDNLVDEQGDPLFAE